MRNQGIELLRVVLMIFVISFHTVSYGNLNLHHPILSYEPNFFQSHFLASFTVVAVNCYVMISGYVRIRACPGKLAAILIPVCFYDVLIGSYFSVASGQFKPFDLLLRIPNSITETYWFVESYIVLFLASPILNELLDEITFRRHLMFIFIGGLVFYLLPMTTLFDFSQGDRGFGIENFVMLYITGDFLRRFISEVKIRSAGTHLCLNLALPSYFLFSALTLLLNLAWATYHHPEDGIQGAFYGYNTFPIYAASVGLFGFFASLEIKNACCVTFIKATAPLAFPVYIIHEQPDIRTRVYNWFSWYSNDHSLWIVFVPMSSILIFSCFAFVEWIRKISIGRIDSRISKALISLYSRI